MKSEVISWNDDRGYGFIRDATGVNQGKDIFVHFSNVLGKGRRKLWPGAEVEFEVTDSEKGKRAVNVQVMN